MFQLIKRPLNKKIVDKLFLFITLNNQKFKTDIIRWIYFGSAWNTFEEKLSKLIKNSFICISITSKK